MGAVWEIREVEVMVMEERQEEVAGIKEEESRREGEVMCRVVECQ